MRQKRTQIRDYRAESALFFRRALVSFAGILVLVSLLLVNLYNIQVSEYEDYATRSNDNRIKFVPVAPNRGLIYDRNGVVLAENLPVFSLDITPEQSPNLDETIASLSELIPITEAEITRFERERRRTRRFNAVPLKNQLTEDEVALFYVNQHRFPGVEVRAHLKRHYPFGDALTHALGYVARINDRDVARLEREEKISNYRATRDIGKLGVERYYEDLLHGTAGYQEVEVNSRGRVIRTLKYVPPIPGKDIYLNIDIDLQLYVQKKLTREVTDPETGEIREVQKRGAIVILDPDDASVLAMVSSPSYDPNLFVHGISAKDYRGLLNDNSRPLVNRVTLGIYPPASTIKPHLAVAALQEEVIDEETTRNDHGSWRIPGTDSRSARAFRDWKRWGHGKVNIFQAIEESVDTFYYQMAYDLGIDRMSVWMNKFGFGDYTGIDIFEESSANMPTREWKQVRHKTPWYKGDTIPIGIGQGYWTATPMQLAKATNVLVNHGKVDAPQLLMRIGDGDESDIVPRPFENITPVRERHWEVALEGMRLVNHGKKGTARASFTQMDYETGGKTGTAQVFGLAEDQEYEADEIEEHLRDHALYVGFAPFDKPELVVSMVLENAGGGSSNAAPLARRIFDHILVTPEITTAELRKVEE
ncbi:penicillin-binding protein 2 [Thaumasiovibrio subtropicus]|uniref:penicillin-binding protein 2 n=1 Tax=Thaumasiovibrio subtropicus TaxID=1891207 RepID=UPI000B3602DC|nr:penicillin-binding protein 2 [Thaumasiovibrio subtropicus]